MSKTFHFDITDKQNKAHICDFEQGLDGSIYIKFPEFEFSKWIGLDFIPYDSPGKGKLSIHGTGVAHVKSFEQNSEAKFRIVGNPLLLKEKNSLGTRHLVTIFPKKPVFDSIDNSQIENQIKPMVFVFFAVPLQLNIEFGGSFNLDEYENIPPVLGIGNLELKTHRIFWFSYNSKFMDNWPSKTHVHFSDGFVCPLFVGVNENQMRIDVRKPNYFIKDNNLKIII